MWPVLVWLALLLAVFGLGYTLAPKGWRTIVINRASAVLAAVMLLADPAVQLLVFIIPHMADFPLNAVLPPKAALIAAFLINLANEFLRKKTTTPVGKDL